VPAVITMQAVRGLIARRQTLQSARQAAAAWPLAAKSRSMSTDEVGSLFIAKIDLGIIFGCGFGEFWNRKNCRTGYLIWSLRNCSLVLEICCGCGFVEIW